MKLKVFIGPKGSGKDTAAKLYPGLAGKIPFAGPLKAICANVFGFDVEDFEDQSLKAQEIHRELETHTLQDLVAGMSEYIALAPWQQEELVDLFSKFEGKEFSSRREILQFIGTEMIRAYDPDWHCKAAFSQNFDASQTWAVTDCRFLNEYEYLKKNHDCRFFYIERPEAEEALALATHQSEREIIEVRARAEAEGLLTVIRNDGSFQDLKDKLEGHWFYSCR